MQHDFDYIIVGSGFGGSVSALRLSEKGYKVLVIEKGKWFKAEDFPRSNWQLRKWFWMPALRFFGIMKLSIFRHIAIISGTGVGGGSLVYANTLPIPKKAFYQSGSWAELADWETELAPFYQKARKMLGASPNPKLFESDHVLQQMAREMGREEHFEHPHVAVYFGKEGQTVSDPYFEGKGPERTGCIYCGGCMTGCRYNAKNTLDKNYLHLAQGLGAEILAEREVIDVRPLNGGDGATGYAVTSRSSTGLLAKKRTVRSQGVIFSGGVMGTIKLLLKLKKKSLPLLSDKLGQDIRTNNETLLSVSTLDKEKNLSQGVAIGSMLHTDERSHLEIVRYSENSGFWKLLHFPLTRGKNVFLRLGEILGRVIASPAAYFRVYWLNKWARSTAVLLFMQTVDNTLKFRRNGLGKMVSSVGFGDKPSPHIPESIALTKKFSEMIHGKPSQFALETLAGIPSTAHILGGAVMGKDASEGVINQHNEVFGYQHMMVVDGSMISANPGVNPSLSITAIAEHAMAQVPARFKTASDPVETVIGT